MNEYKISIIIPIFNAEDYLINTINSVINQTIGFENIELILIDDNSTDESAKIIEMYSNQYDNIKPIFLKENHGYPGYARNTGIKKANSDYIMFLDNDDEYDKNICEILYKTMINEKCDLVGCDFLLIDILGEYEINSFPKNKYEQLKNQEIEYYTDETYTILHNDTTIYYSNNSIWNKLYKKDLIIKNNIYFITDQHNEDSIFTLEYLLKSKKIVHINNYFGYKHIMHGENLSTHSLKYNLSMLKSYYIYLEILNKHNVNKQFIEKFISGSLKGTLVRGISMQNVNFSKRYDFLKKIKKFENFTKFNGNIDNSLVNIVNKLILKNHVLTATILMSILNLIYSNKKILKVYRKFLYKN